jgi:PAS domain S-box-containing protein
MADRETPEAARARLQAILDSAVDGIVTIDERGTIRSFNAAAEAMFGYRAEEAIGRDVSMLMPSPYREEHKGYVESYLRTGVRKIIGIGRDVVARRRDGSTFPMRLSVGEAKVGGRRTFTAILHDMTELEKAREKLLQSERLAAIGEMLAGLSHESRNALQQMEGCLDALQGEASSHRAQDLVTRLRRAQRQLRHLYDDLRAFAAPVRLSPQECELDRLWRASWADLGAGGRGPLPQLADETTCADLRCEVDPFAIGQVFRNVLDNAIGFSPPGATVTVRCGAAEIDGRPALEVVVRDRGPGFAPGHEARVFVPFYTTRSEGTGLGLAIVRRIVDAHGGRVLARNAEGGGAELVLVLPRAQRSSAAEASSSRPGSR